MKRLLMLMLLYSAIGLVTAQTETTSSAKPLRVGLLPYLSTQKLLEQFAPVKKYLEAQLQRPVSLLTAADFKTYIERTQNDEYDIYLTAPHFAAYAENQFGHRRVCRTTRELTGAFYINKGSSIHSLIDLRGKTIASPDVTAIVTMLGELTLSEAGLIPGKDVTIIYTPSHNNAIITVANHQADAAVAASNVFDTMPQNVRDDLVRLQETRSAPNVMFMASKNLSKQEYLRIRKFMLEFTAAGAGKEFFANSSYGDMAVITDKDMERLKPFISLLKKRLITPTNTVAPGYR